jgi:hypothetical protein
VGGRLVQRYTLSHMDTRESDRPGFRGLVGGARRRVGAGLGLRARGLRNRHGSRRGPPPCLGAFPTSTKPT